MGYDSKLMLNELKFDNKVLDNMFESYASKARNSLICATICLGSYFLGVYLNSDDVPTSLGSALAAGGLVGFILMMAEFGDNTINHIRSFRKREIKMDKKADELEQMMLE